MKTKLITLLIAIFAVIGSAYTQTKVNIYKGRDVLYSLPVAEIDSIKFDKQKNYYKNGHEYVDLGLSVKWATCNVGADTPEDYGDYFAWGETSSKDIYSSKTYNCSLDVSTTPTLPLLYDVANVKWGDGWRMPTVVEQEELRDTNNCIWTWTTQNGINGFRVTSKKNGNSIFLPAAGYRYEGNLIYEGNSAGYWSSSINTEAYSYAFYIAISSGSVTGGSNNKYLGHSIRPVCE